MRVPLTVQCGESSCVSKAGNRASDSPRRPTARRSRPRSAARSRVVGAGTERLLGHIGAALNSATVVVQHSDQGSQGGFNWSSQHLQLRGSCGATRGVDQGIAPERRRALSRGSIASAGSAASILGTDYAAIRRRVLPVFRYIEGWCNPRGRHCALGQRSPLAFD